MTNNDNDGHVWIINEEGVTVCRICGTKRGEGKMAVSMKLSL